MSELMALTGITTEIAVVGGQVITIGVVASFLFQSVKWVNKFLVPRVSWMEPWEFNRSESRISVAALATLVNLFVTWKTGGVVDISFVWETFVSYTVAITSYDHAKKQKPK